jgi:hypothetical protein
MNIEYAKAIRESFEKMAERINDLEKRIRTSFIEAADSQMEGYEFFKRVLREVQYQQAILRSKTDVELVEMIQATYEKLSDRIDSLEEGKIVR